MIQEIVDKEQEPTEPGRLILYHAPEDVIECGQLFTNWGILPDGNNWLEVSLEWRHDLLTFLQWKAWKAHESQPDAEDED
jgi:hypothetical protein